MIINKKTFKRSISENFSIRTFKKNWAKLLKLSLVIAATYLVSYLILKENINLSNITAGLNNLASITPTNIIAIGIYIILINSLLEEFFWRGFIFKELDQLTPPILTHIITGVAFSFHHILFYYTWFDLGLILIATAGLALFAIIMNIIFQRYKDLFSCWFVHGLVVIIQIYITLNIFRMI